MEQNDREKTLIKFRNGSLKILLCTDLAARGLDIPSIQQIIHYQLPSTFEIYTHRNGRTARMQAEGTAYLILSEREHAPKFIEDKIENIQLPENLQIPQNPKWLTLYMPLGKKDKINKIDLAGIFFKKGQLNQEELGKIEVLDHASYIAVKTKKISNLLSVLNQEKIKNKKIKLNVAS